MNGHERLRDLLPLAAAGALDREDQTRLEEHLKGCASCQEEWATWMVYAGGLRALPQELVPNYLAERTHAQMLYRQEVLADRRNNAVLLVVLSVFGWSLSLALWLVVRLAMGGAVMVLRPDLWALLSTGVVWACGATAAVVLAPRRKGEWRSAL